MDILHNIIVGIFCTIFLLLCIGLIVYVLIYQEKMDKLRQQYLSTLSKEEKSVVLDYIHCKPSLLLDCKKRTKKGK